MWHDEVQFVAFVAVWSADLLPYGARLQTILDGAAIFEPILTKQGLGLVYCILLAVN